MSVMGSGVWCEGDLLWCKCGVLPYPTYYVPYSVLTSVCVGGAGGVAAPNRVRLH